MAAYLFALAYLGAFITYRVALALGGRSRRCEPGAAERAGGRCWSRRCAVFAAWRLLSVALRLRALEALDALPRGGSPRWLARLRQRRSRSRRRLRAAAPAADAAHGLGRARLRGIEHLVHFAVDDALLVVAARCSRRPRGARNSPPAALRRYSLISQRPANRAGSAAPPCGRCPSGAGRATQRTPPCGSRRAAAARRLRARSTRANPTGSEPLRITSGKVFGSPNQCAIWSPSRCPISPSLGKIPVPGLRSSRYSRYTLSIQSLSSGEVRASRTLTVMTWQSSPDSNRRGIRPH